MKDTTHLLHTGRDPQAHHGVVNTPVYHASTIIFPSLADLDTVGQKKYPSVTYGRRGTPTTFALEKAVSEIEQGAGSILLPSGINAIATALMAFLETGDHLLMIDSAYDPTRSLTQGILARMGIETTFFDPLIGDDLQNLIQPNTRVVFLEAPGSLTFEMPDIPTLTKIAAAHDLTVMMDNTWATPLYFKPFSYGVHISLHAGTKYIVGHSDAMVGIATAADEETFLKLRKTAGDLGLHLSPGDAALAARGLRTMGVRLPVHMQNGLELAAWLQAQPDVVRVLHPGLSSDPGHAIWSRDFTGASGLFSCIVKPKPRAALAHMLDHLELFGMGFSWGGYESLILPAKPSRAVRNFDPEEGWLVRLHAGLDDCDDLKADLAAGFKRYAEF